MILRLVAAFLLCLVAPQAFADNAFADDTVAWKTGREAAAIERRIDALLAKMTLEEKVGQLHLSGRGDGFDINQIKTGHMGGVMNFVVPSEVLAVQHAARESRLKIPVIIGLDAVHGFSTYFPLPLGQASTWNPKLIEEAAYWTGREARAAGIQWTFAPMVDISRDPRWGRVLEGAGRTRISPRSWPQRAPMAISAAASRPRRSISSAMARRKPAATIIRPGSRRASCTISTCRRSRRRSRRAR